MGRRVVSEAQWLAARAVSEGAVPTRARVAAVLGIDPSFVFVRSAREGWTVIDGRNMEIRALYREAQAIAAALSGRAAPDEPDDEAALTLDDPARDATGAQELAPGSDGQTPAASAALSVPEWDRLEPVELLANASAFVARQIGRLIQAADRRGGRLDRSQVEGLAALAKMMDRWEALARERAVENKAKSDEDLGRVLERIDRRIVELAVEGAQFLDERRRRKRAASRRRGMGDAGALGAGAALAPPAG